MVDDSIDDILGEPVTITRAVPSVVLTDVMVIIDRGVPIDLGDAVTAGYTLSYTLAAVVDIGGDLAEGDRIDTEASEVFLVSRQLEGDDARNVRILIKQ